MSAAAAEFAHCAPLTWNGGGLPHNAAACRLSAGQAGAAGGFLGSAAAMRRPTLSNQAPGATTGLVSGGGMVNYDRRLGAAAMILAREGP